jgi:hypothetical protein
MIWVYKLLRLSSLAAVMAMLIALPANSQSSNIATSPLDACVSASLAALHGDVPKAEIREYLESEFGSRRYSGRSHMPRRGTIRYFSPEARSSYPYRGVGPTGEGYLAASDYGWIVSQPLNEFIGTDHGTTAIARMDFESFGLSIGSGGRTVVVTTPALVSEFLIAPERRWSQLRDNGFHDTEFLDYWLILHASRDPQLFLPILSDPSKPGFSYAWQAIILGSSGRDALSYSCLHYGMGALHKLFERDGWKKSLSLEEAFRPGSVRDDINRAQTIFFLQVAAGRIDLREVWDKYQFDGHQWDMFRHNLIYSIEVNHSLFRYSANPLKGTGWYRKYQEEWPRMSLMVHMREAADYDKKTR